MSKQMNKDDADKIYSVDKLLFKKITRAKKRQDT